MYNIRIESMILYNIAIYRIVKNTSNKQKNKRLHELREAFAFLFSFFRSTLFWEWGRIGGYQTSLAPLPPPRSTI